MNCQQTACIIEDPSPPALTCYPALTYIGKMSIDYCRLCVAEKIERVLEFEWR